MLSISGKFQRFISLCVFHLSAAFPVPRSAEPKPPLSVTAGSDAWAEALAGVGPLVLLIGERNTKQLLREAHGLPSILSMSFAPIGLLSVLTSMIRLCGSRNLRAYLGYEHEPRAKAALEMTKANCGEIHAEMVDGCVSRSTAADPPSKALAVTYLVGYSELAVTESLQQIEHCRAFEAEKTSRGCPVKSGMVRWCFRLAWPLKDENHVKGVARIISRALGIEISLEVNALLSTLKRSGTGLRGEPAVQPLDGKVNDQCASEVCCKHCAPNPFISLTSSKKNDSALVTAVSETTEIQSVTTPAGPDVTLGEINPQFVWNRTATIATEFETYESKSTMATTSFATTSAGVAIANHNAASDERFRLPQPLKSIFFCTFDGISEVSTSRHTSTTVSLLIAGISFLSMISVQTICLWQEGWFSLGIAMVFVGYVCMVIGVSAAGYMIYTSCDSTAMQTQPKTDISNWTQGAVIAAKSPDSMDTTGSRFMKLNEPKLTFEAVWLKEPGQRHFIQAWVISIFLTLSFICYYLGLRSSQWWLGVIQLLICLLSAFARSMGKMDYGTFAVAPEIRVDKRCYSTGVLEIERASKIPPGQNTAATLDLRIYSPRSINCRPLSGELVAWRAALICMSPEYWNMGDSILSTVGLKLVITGDADDRHVVVLFNGGVVTDEGLAFPNATLCTAFTCSKTDLAAPTPLLARLIMRQQEWSARHTQIRRDTLRSVGGTYITSFDQLVSWWTFSEDRNDIGDMHKNLHGSFIVICMAFFVALLRNYPGDSTLREAIQVAHETATDDDEANAANMVTFLQENI